MPAGQRNTVTTEVSTPRTRDGAARWTVIWDGTLATVTQTHAVGDENTHESPERCVQQVYTDDWLAKGGDGLVINEIITMFAGKGAQVRILSMNGDMPNRLASFARNNPQCRPEMRMAVGA